MIHGPATLPQAEAAMAAAGTIPPMPAPVVELENVRKSFAMPGGETVAVLDVDRFVLEERPMDLPSLDRRFTGRPNEQSWFLLAEEVDDPRSQHFLQ